MSAIVLNDVSKNEGKPKFNNNMNNHKDLSAMVSCPIVSIQHNDRAFDELALLLLS